MCETFTLDRRCKSRRLRSCLLIQCRGRSHQRCPASIPSGHRLHPLRHHPTGHAACSTALQLVYPKLAAACSKNYVGQSVTQSCLRSADFQRNGVDLIATVFQIPPGIHRRFRRQSTRRAACLESRQVGRQLSDKPRWFPARFSDRGSVRSRIFEYARITRWMPLENCPVTSQSDSERFRIPRSKTIRSATTTNSR